LYARVSTSDQSCEAQLHALRAYAQARGGEVVEYVDAGGSGAKDRRPALDRLLADARRRRFDAVVVVKLDRLGRSLRHLLTLLGDFEALGVGFISLDDGLDTSTAAGRLFMQMRGAFAEYELAMIRERTRAGLAAARRRGKRLGRPNVLTPEQLARVARLRRGGASMRGIAEILGTSKGTVQRALEGQRRSTRAA
jgi:DNA invertase Pin-like site-specific DNA recombinase